MWGLFKKKEEPKRSSFQTRTMVVADAFDILTVLQEPVAREYFESTINMYLDWSMTGSLQKLAGVDIIVVQASVILNRIEFSVKTERRKNINTSGVVDTLQHLLAGVDYVNIYRPTKSQERPNTYA